MPRIIVKAPAKKSAFADALRGDAQNQLHCYKLASMRKKLLSLFASHDKIAYFPKNLCRREAAEWMIFMQICAKLPLPVKGCNQYQGMAFDGCCYYLTSKTKPQIVVLDHDFKITDCIKTCRQYTSICYDKADRCFWAAAEGCYYAIFKLDCHFQEVDRLSLGIYSGCITGVSHCCAADCLLVSTSSSILRVSKQGEKTKELRACRCVFVTGVCCVSPCYLYHYLDDGKQSLIAVCGEAAPKPIALPNDFLLKAVVYTGEHQGAHQFDLLVQLHGCYPYLYRVCLSHCTLGTLAPCNRPGHCCEQHPPCDCREPISLEDFCCFDLCGEKTAEHCGCEQCQEKKPFCDCCCEECGKQKPYEDCCCEECGKEKPYADCCCEECGKEKPYADCCKEKQEKETLFGCCCEEHKQKNNGGFDPFRGCKQPDFDMEQQTDEAFANFYGRQDAPINPLWALAMAAMEQAAGQASELLRFSSQSAPQHKQEQKKQERPADPQTQKTKTVPSFRYYQPKRYPEN